VRGSYEFERIFRKKAFIVRIMLAKISRRLEGTEVRSRVFSEEIACGLIKRRVVGRKVELVCRGPLSFNLLRDGSC
jgi:hypothetical protein